MLASFATSSRLVFCLLALASYSLAQEDISPLTSDPYAPDGTPEQVAAANQRGAAAAGKDIERGIFQILDYGFPPPSGASFDRETGYLVRHINTCGVSSGFLAELYAYNRVMREWHEKKKGESNAK
jgi:hypothetical protein